MRRRRRCRQKLKKLESVLFRFYVHAAVRYTRKLTTKYLVVSCTIPVIRVSCKRRREITAFVAIIVVERLWLPTFRSILRGKHSWSSNSAINNSFCVVIEKERRYTTVCPVCVRLFGFLYSCLAAVNLLWKEFDRDKQSGRDLLKRKINVYRFPVVLNK